MKFNILLLFVLISHPIFAQWQMLESGTSASFRSMDVVNKKVVWAGGSNNTVLKTINGGKTWQNYAVNPELTLDFRGIKGFDKNIAIAVSAGLAEEGQAKIFKTTDGGLTWSLVFETKLKGVFLDGIAFFDKMYGMVIGDPIDNQAYILETKDGGNTWQRVDTSLFPKTNEGEASFAASNSCLVTYQNEAWYAFQSRILHTPDQGKTWEALNSKFPPGTTSGIFGLHFWSKSDGVLLGGDYKDDKTKQVNFAKTMDGGKTWKSQEITPQGLKESAGLVKGKLIVVGTSGTSISTDLGESWKVIDKASFHVVDCSGKYCYAIGAKGHLGKMRLK
ncbi:YCF48-related protein [Arcticibacterium luteifluviistationis]|uniref:Oxidoreductase n=1 Tax=Arcticibacterium luteifluviistationis TaxID=1784714 RepID=A0A2Z4GDT8_9BACT|nr:YCF48-related protein [Arcticibacterium luteifluviistationis]AWV99073.1 oxidoreductase [Arcticibacterium luteifluviistationis]